MPNPDLPCRSVALHHRHHVGRPLLARAAIVAAACACACATTSSAPPPAASPSPSPATTAIAATAAAVTDAVGAAVGAPDRSADDRALDGGRHPAELLALAGVAPGQRVAELQAGGGYTAELLARTV